MSRLPRDSITNVLSLLGRPGDPVPYAWRKMLADQSGRLWLLRVECRDSRAPYVWDVIDLAGRQLAVVTTKRYLVAARGDRVLAVLFDSLDRSFATMFALDGK
jgi:hypothetical protein